MKQKYGFTLMEVILTIALLTMMTSIFVPLLVWLTAKSAYVSYKNRAGLVIQEGIEVAYNVLLTEWDEDYLKYSDTIIYHSVVDGGKWGLGTGKEEGVDGLFEREISFEKVCRNKDTGKWVEGITGCSDPWVWDKNSKLIKTTVSWKEQGKDKQEQAQLLITKI